MSHRKVFICFILLQIVVLIILTIGQIFISVLKVRLVPSTRVDDLIVNTSEIKASSFLLSFERTNTGEEKLPLTIISNRGRLGNQMGTFATLYGLARLNNRKPVLQPHTATYIGRYFKTSVPSTESLSETNHSLPAYKIGRYIRSSDVTIPKQVVILRGHKTPNSPTFYDFVRYEIKREFRFIDPIDHYADSVLRKIRHKFPRMDTFVGIHVRRTDMNKVLLKYGASLPDTNFFNKSMSYFMSRYRNVTFIVVSDDRKWCKENLKHPKVVITPNPPSPAHDMAVLSKCNHSIITKGTFGRWAGYLAGGETIYFKPFPPNHFFLKLNPYELMYVPEWIGMS